MMNLDIKNKMEVKVLQYFDYSIINFDEKTGVKELLIQDIVSHYEIIPKEIYDDKKKIQEYIVSRVRKECIADIAMVVVYHFVMDKDYYDIMNNGYHKLKGDKILLDYFRNVIILPDICKVEMSFPVAVNEKIPRNRIYQ